MSHEDELALLKTQVDQVQSVLRQAEQSLGQLKARLETLEAERREYRKAIIETLPDGPADFTPEELEDLRKNGVTWDIIEQDLKQILEG